MGKLIIFLPEDITELPGPGQLYPSKQFYPGEWYKLSHRSAEFQTRISDKHGEIMSLANQSGKLPYLKRHAEKK